MAQEIYHRSEWGNPTEQWGNVYLNADLTNELYKRASEYENSWVTDQLLNGVGTKPSIILTPTAYEDGVLNSVKPQRTFGSELVTNGSFDTDSDWTKGTGWSISGGKASCDGSQAAGTGVYQNIGSQSGKIIKFSFNVSNYISGTLNTAFFGASGTTVYSINNNGDYTFYINIQSGHNGNTGFIANADFIGSIDNVSVKEVIDADFDFTRGSSATRVNEQGLVEDVQILSGELVQNGDFEQIGSEVSNDVNFDNPSNWSLTGQSTVSNGKAHIVQNDASNTGITANTTITNKTYKITGVVSDYVSGSVGFASLGSTNPRVAIPSENGAFTIYYTSTRSTPSTWNIQRITSPCDLKLDNVSVKEVGQNWTFGTGWSMGDGVVSLNAPTGNLDQSLSTSSGSKYRVTFTISNYVSGDIRWRFTGTSNENGTLRSANGTYTEEITLTNSQSIFRFPATGGVMDIDNVSVIEITDDTDLPRINYTNFDYEDVLGDELVTNGTFDSDSNWSKGTGWSIANGRASYDGSGLGYQFILQAITTTSGSTYQITFDVLSSTGSNLNIVDFGSVRVNQSHLTEGNYTFYAQADSSSENIIIYANGTDTFSIDNVSVKEITYDVVVPYSGEGSLLLEPQSTNLITYSEDFSDSSWQKYQISVNDDFIISPDGTKNASKITINSSAPFLGNTNISLTSGDVYTISCFVKKGTNRWVRLVSVSSATLGAWFDLENNVVGTVNSTSASIENYGNGWYRISNTITAISGSNQAFLGLSDADGGTSSTQVGNTVFAFGFQVEEGYATSYIPTEGSIKTRLADVCNNSGNSDLINSTEGVLYAEIKALNDDISQQIGVYGNSSTKQLRLEIANSVIRAQLFNGAYQTNMSSTQTVKNFNKIAFKWKVNDFALWINGTEVATDSSGSTFSNNDLDRLNLSAQNGTSSLAKAEIKCVAVFKEALSDTELQKLTTI